MSEDVFDARRTRIRTGYYETHDTLWYVFRRKEDDRWIAEREDGERYLVVAQNNNTLGESEIRLGDFYPHDLAQVFNTVESSRQKIALVKRHTSDSKLNNAIEERTKMNEARRLNTWS